MQLPLIKENGQKSKLQDHFGNSWKRNLLALKNVVKLKQVLFCKSHQLIPLYFILSEPNKKFLSLSYVSEVELESQLLFLLSLMSLPLRFHSLMDIYVWHLKSSSPSSLISFIENIHPSAFSRGKKHTVSFYLCCVWINKKW